MVTFGIPNITYCDNANVTKWKVEWDVSPTFDSLGTGAALSYNATLGTSPEVEDRGDGEGELEASPVLLSMQHMFEKYEPDTYW